MKSIDNTIDDVLRRAIMASTKTVGVMVPVDEKGKPVCPVCAERRKRNAERVRQWRMKKKGEQTEQVKPTPEQIEAARTPRGGWTKTQLAQWGVPWPPPKGWREKLEEDGQ